VLSPEAEREYSAYRAKLITFVSDEWTVES
jgi:hypothetical protein